MAELTPRLTPHLTPRLTLGERWRPYRAVLASRLRSQTSYRANFALDVVSSLLVGLVELAEVWVLYHAAHSVGGLTLSGVLLVWGLAEIGFSLADMVVGHCDRLPTFVRAGTVDVFWLRPQPVLLQLMTSDISLRRLARTLVGVAALVAALRLNHLSPTAGHVTMVLVAVASAFAIFSGTFVAAAGVQFFVLNGSELANAFTYGGRYASTQPASVWSRPMLALFGFAVPMVFCGYLPTLWLLGLPSPVWLPAWAAWLAPLAAAWTWLLAGTAWRFGTRHYQGGGG